MPYWLHEFTSDGVLKASDNSLIVSILSAGTFFGALASAPLADTVGRRLGLMLATGIVFNLGVILQVAATGQSLFIAGRFFAGLGVGLVSAQSKFAISLSKPCANCKLLWESRWYLTPTSPNVPIRNLPEMDSWYHCGRIPACYHDWLASRCHCQ